MNTSSSMEPLLRRLRVSPSLRRKAIEVELETRAPCSVVLELGPNRIEAPAATAPLRLEADALAPWHMDTPLLHTLAIELRSPEDQTERHHVYIGLRDVGIAEQRYTINNQPLRFRSTLLAAPFAPAIGDSEQLGQTLASIKAAGFSAITLAPECVQRPVLEHCDRLGLLVEAICDADGSNVHALWEAPFQSTYPSLALYRVPASLPGAEQIAARIHERDGTRPVLVFRESPGDTSCIFRPGHPRPDSAATARLDVSPPLDARAESFVRSIGDTNQLTHIQLAGPKAVPVSFERRYRERELDAVFGKYEDFAKLTARLQADAARFAIDALRANPNVAGYCYAPVLPSDADPALLETFGRLQRAIRPLIQAPDTTLVPREEIDVAVLLANRAKREGRADVSLAVVGPTNQVLWKKRRNVRIPKHARELWSGSVGASGATGTHKFVVRLLDDEQVLGESAVELHVVGETKRVDVPVRVLDPQESWTPAIEGMTRVEPENVPLILVPPLANRIGAYPGDDLCEALGHAKAGACMVVFEPPSDWNALAHVIRDAPCSTRVEAPHTPDAIYVRPHPVFDGLPSRTLLRQPYRDIAPSYTYAELGDSDVAGSFALSAEATDSPWGAAVSIQRYGEGRVVFVALRILDRLEHDPIARRLFVNLLEYLAPRATATDRPAPIPQRAFDWMRQARRDRLRRWLICGLFPNDATGLGHETAYPPESGVDTAKHYPGAYAEAAWRTWHSSAEDAHRVDLRAACEASSRIDSSWVSATAYAFAEFVCDTRSGATLEIRAPGAIKAWHNGTLVLEEAGHDGPFSEQSVHGEIFVRQGRNTLLIKCSAPPGPLGFSISIDTDRGVPLPVTWWR